MAKQEKVETTPAPSSLKQQASSAASKNGSILSFFSKASNGTPTQSTGVWKPRDEAKGVNALPKLAVPVKKPAFRKAAIKSVTPVPSSDAIGPSSSQENENGGIPEEVEAGLPSPITPAKRVVAQEVNGDAMVLGSSPSRKVSCHTFCPAIANTSSRPKRLLVTQSLTTMRMMFSTQLSLRKDEKSNVKQ